MLLKCKCNGSIQEGKRGFEGMLSLNFVLYKYTRTGWCLSISRGQCHMCSKEGTTATTKESVELGVHRIRGDRQTEARSLGYPKSWYFIMLGFGIGRGHVHHHSGLVRTSWEKNTLRRIQYTKNNFRGKQSVHFLGWSYRKIKGKSSNI